MVEIVVFGIEIEFFVVSSGFYWMKFVKFYGFFPVFLREFFIYFRRCYSRAYSTCKENVVGACKCVSKNSDKTCKVYRRRVGGVEHCSEESKGGKRRW